jgi:hypothetical protein
MTGNKIGIIETKTYLLGIEVGTIRIMQYAKADMAAINVGKLIFPTLQQFSIF